MRKNASVSVELKAPFRDFTDTIAKEHFCIGRVEGPVSRFHRYNCKETVLYRYSFDSEIKKLPIQKHRNDNVSACFEKFVLKATDS